MTTQRDDGHLAATEDRELRALFDARRPDAALFRAGVAARLQNSAGAGGAGPLPAERNQPWRKRAASWLPALPPETSLGPTWSTWLSLPALLLLGCFATFWRGDRSLVAALQGARATTPQRQTSRPVGTWWRRHAHWLWAGGVGVLLGGLGYFVSQAVLDDVILFGLVASMAVLVANVGVLAARDGAPTEVTGRCVTDLLVATGFGLGWSRVLGDRGVVATEAGAAIVLGLGTLAVLTLRGWRERRPGLGLASAIALIALGVPLAVLPWLETTDYQKLRRELAQATPPGDDQAHWRALELCGDALRTAGETLPDLTTLRQHLASLIADSPGAWPQTWTTGANLGLISAEQWQRLASTKYVASFLPQLLSERGRMLVTSHDRYLLPALLAMRELTASDRAHLVERIEHTWPDPPAPNSGADLGTALLCVQWLDVLERGDLVAARVPALRDLLRRHWVPQSAVNWARTTGGFAARAGDDKALLPETIDALALSVRIGPPPEIAVPELQAFLRQQVRLYTGLSGWGKQAHAGSVLLDAKLGVPSRGWQWLVDQRLLVSCVLLVLLAMRAVWFTRHLGGRGQGAMP